MCGSTILRVLYGVLSGFLFFTAGARLLESGLGFSPVVYALLGVWLGWIAISGAT
jgi:hypothetical protein